MKYQPFWFSLFYKPLIIVIVKSPEKLLKKSKKIGSEPSLVKISFDSNELYNRDAKSFIDIPLAIYYIATMQKKGKRKKITLQKFSSFEEAEAFNREEDAKMSPEERLDLMQYLRELYYGFKNIRDARRKRLRRVVKIIQQT